MARTKQDPTALIRAAYIGLAQESELVVAIFRSAFIVIAAFAPLMGGGMSLTRLAMQVSIGAAILYNLIVIILYWLHVHLRGQRGVMVLFDIALATVWVYLTWNTGIGESGSPLFPYYYIIVISAALWYGVPGALLSAGLISVFYLFTSVYQSGLDPFALIDALYRQVVYVFMVAIISGYLVDTHKREREQWARSQVLLAQYQERFRAAQEMYELLIPAKPPQVSGLELAARWKPALHEGGGDFYDVITLPDGRVVITMADVSGKFTRGALKLPLFKAAFLASAQVWADPGEVLAHVNRIVYPLLQPDMFISACVLVIDPRDHRLQYANAGQDPPVFIRHNTHEIVHLETGGLVLGVDEDAAYPTEEQRLEPGDTLALYTDGITEARNAAEEEFGVQALEARMQAAVAVGWNADEIAENIFDAVNHHAHGLPRHDDMTLLIVRNVPEEPTTE